MGGGREDEGSGGVVGRVEAQRQGRWWILIGMDCVMWRWWNRSTGGVEDGAFGGSGGCRRCGVRILKEAKTRGRNPERVRGARKDPRNRGRIDIKRLRGMERRRGNSNVSINHRIALTTGSKRQLTHVRPVN